MGYKCDRRGHLDLLPIGYTNVTSQISLIASHARLLVERSIAVSCPAV